MAVSRRTGPFSDTKDAVRFPYVASCDEGACFYVVSAATDHEAYAALAGHQCPHTDTLSVFSKLTNVQAKMWAALDSVVDGIMLARSGDPASIEKLEFRKGLAHGLAMAIAGMQSYMPTEKDVSREAARRYKMRIGEIEYSRTPGDRYDPLRDGVRQPEEDRWQARVNHFRDMVKTRRVDPPPNPSPVVHRTAARRTARATQPAASSYSGPPPMVPISSSAPGSLSEDVRNGILQSLSSGIFDHKTIATMFQVPVSVVASLDA